MSLMGSPETPSPIPNDLECGLESPRSEPAETVYQPLHTLEETLAKIGTLLEKPSEEVSDMEVFEAIADTFVTRCEEYRRAGIRYEYGGEVEWRREDERGFYMNGERSFTIGYYIPETSNGLNEAWYDNNDNNLTFNLQIQGGQLEIHGTDFGVEPEVDTVFETLPPETKTGILSSLQQGLNSPLGTS